MHSRRELLQLGMAGVVGASGHAAYGPLREFARGIKNQMRGGRLVTIGVKPPGFLPTPVNSDASVLMEFDLKKQTQRHVPFDVKDAHSLVSVGHGKGFVLVSNNSKLFFVDDQFQIQSEVFADRGWEFGGHGVYLEAQNLLVAGLRPSSDNEGSGKLCVIDVGTHRVVSQQPSGGLDPHDMEHLSDGRFAVCHYGDRFRADLMDYKNLTPSICIFSSKTLTLERTIAFPKIGAVSHVCQGSGTSFAAITANLYVLSESALGTVSSLAGGGPLVLSPSEEIEQRVGGPSPLVFLDRDSEKLTSSLTDSAKQRRAQSILYHEKTRCYFVTYPFSGTIARIAENGDTTFVSAFDLGISAPRGVAAFSNDDSVYICGQHSGIAEIDAKTLQVVSRIDVQNFGATHIFAI